MINLSAKAQVVEPIITELDGIYAAFKVVSLWASACNCASPILSLPE
jgi:hypothetical protein